MDEGFEIGICKMMEMVRIICFDGELKAQKQAERLGRELQNYPGETQVVKLETGEDPADADPGEIRELRERFLGIDSPLPR